MSHYHQNTGGGYSGPRGRGSRPPDNNNPSHHHKHVGASNNPFASDSPDSKDGMLSQGRGKYSPHISRGRGSKHFNDKSTSNYMYRPKNPSSLDVLPNSMDAGGSHRKQHECVADDRGSLSAQSDSRNVHLDGNRHWIGKTPQKEVVDSATLILDFSDKVNVGCVQEKSPLPARADTKDRISHEKGSKNSASAGDSWHSVKQTVVEPFDNPSRFDNSPHLHKHVGASEPFTNGTSGGKVGISLGRGKYSRHITKPFNDKPTSNYDYQHTSPSSDALPNSLHAGGCHMKQPECFVEDLHSLSAQSHSKNVHLAGSGIRIGKTPQKEAEDSVTLSCAQESPLSSRTKPFDICPPKTGIVMLKPSLLVKNRQKRNEVKRTMEGQNGKILRSGMVLLKNYISITDQVKIVKMCRNLGVGSGGFYQPGYRDGADLHLKMMCLGKNWDPETSEYGSTRSIDGAKPPAIPAEFYHLVEKAIQDSHSFIKENSKVKNVEAELPWMLPDICIVNYYSAAGKLGLHKDKDESEASLKKGLPVVSFSIGDSAEFLYGDERDVEKADTVKLESGDVLIFGGKSRDVFHGVTKIEPNTAPSTLLEETNFRPGRLNLTFRQY